MRVVRADAMGLCFGVRDALDAAVAVPRPERVTIHGELVHNEVVLSDLAGRGFHMADEGDRDQQVPSTDAVMITAHGVSNAERERLATSGKEIIDTTCPLVSKAHDVAMRLGGEGRHVIVIGRVGHVEVRGLVGDLKSWTIIGSLEDVRALPFEKIGIMSQTTFPEADVRRIVQAIRTANPSADVEFVDTVCEPTKQRVRAIDTLASQVDVAVVVGGTNSNNTRQLARMLTARGVRAHLVQNAADLEPEWFEGCEEVGLTAGTSTPDSVIDAVASALETISTSTVSAR